MFQTCTETDLFPPGRQAGVASDASLDVEIALAMTTEVDGAWSDVDIHEVVDDSALDVVNNAVHQVSTAHIHDLYVRHVAEKERKNRSNFLNTEVISSSSRFVCGSSPVQIFVQRLIGGLVTLYPLHEVFDGLL